MTATAGATGRFETLVVRLLFLGQLLEVGELPRGARAERVDGLLRLGGAGRGRVGFLKNLLSNTCISPIFASVSYSFLSLLLLQMLAASVQCGLLSLELLLMDLSGLLLPLLFLLLAHPRQLLLLCAFSRFSSKIRKGLSVCPRECRLKGVKRLTSPVPPSPPAPSVLRPPRPCRGCRCRGFASSSCSDRRPSYPEIGQSEHFMEGTNTRHN